MKLIFIYQQKGSKMLLTTLYLAELEQEALSTKKLLEIVPNDKFDWRPHPKSMTVRSLVTHIAEIPSWISTGILTDELDLSKTPFTPKEISNTDEVLAFFEESVMKGKSVLVEKNESKLADRWVMKNGDMVFVDQTKAEVIRHSLSQLIHHRAQLGVFLRLLDIPLPGVYGPTADDSKH